MPPLPTCQTPGSLLPLFSFSYLRRSIGRWFHKEKSPGLLTYSEPHSQALRVLSSHLRIALLFTAYVFSQPRSAFSFKEDPSAEERSVEPAPLQLEKLDRHISSDSTLQGSLSPVWSPPVTQQSIYRPPGTMSGEPAAPGATGKAITRYSPRILTLCRPACIRLRARSNPTSPS